MKDIEQLGRLIPLPSGYWGIVYAEIAGEKNPDDEIHSGEMIFLQVGNGALCQTRIEYDHQKRRFYSVEGYDLKVGLRACRGASLI